MIKVKICLGTACYVLGGTEFTQLQDCFTEKELKNISFEISTCMDLCKLDNAKPPYVIINDELFENADKLLIIAEIKNILKEIEDDRKK